MLKLLNVSAGYGELEVLHRVSLAVPAGAVVSLLGANSAGKTTTVHTVLGMVRAQEGQVFFEDVDITQHPTASIVALGIGLVPEGRRVFGGMTVQENLFMGAYINRGPGMVKAGLDRVFELFPRLAERRRQLAGTLSGGEQQMLAIGRALMGNPKLILMDEPSMGLAPVLVDRVFDAVSAINRQGVTLLLVEQSASMALAISQFAYVLQGGRIVFSGAPEVLKKQSQLEAAYLGGS